MSEPRNEYERVCAERNTLREKVETLEARLAPYVSPESEPGMGPTETDRGCLVRMYNQLRDAERERDALRAKVAELESLVVALAQVRGSAPPRGKGGQAWIGVGVDTCTPAERRVLDACRVATVQTVHIGRAVPKLDQSSAIEVAKAIEAWRADTIKEEQRPNRNPRARSWRTR
jgi:hypothetical protein